MPRLLSWGRPGPRRGPPAARASPVPSSVLVMLVVLLVPGALSTGLYSPEDPVVLLAADNLEQNVFNSSSVWVVEFYASWCGHCIRFAPVWKELAGDISGWRPAVMLGAMDCAEKHNQKICSEFGITGYPTIKFFKAFSTKPEDGERLLHHGDGIRSLRESIITSMEKHERAWPPAWPTLEPISATECNSFFRTHSVRYLALIFENEDSFLGREITLDLLDTENLAVRRVLKSNEELVNFFNVTTFPSGLLLLNNGHSNIIPVRDTRSFYTGYLERLPGVIRRNSIRPTVVPSVIPQTTPPPWRVADRKKLYMADLESAVVYTLRSEAARFLHLDKERLSALKQYVTVLNKYFPGRIIVMNYLRNLELWLSSKTNVSQSDWEEALRNKAEHPYAKLPDNPLWVGCQGSRPEFRGFPCSLWVVFHLLTVREALLSPNYNSPSEVLPTMRGYVRNFFGCLECASHFESMAAESMDNVKNKDEAVLWLWSRHNKVNNRLSGAPSDDPKFPKIQWPPQDLCLSCTIVVNGKRIWNERAILSFLKSHFSRENIYLDFIVHEKVHPRLVHDIESEGKLEQEQRGGGEENGGGDEEEFKEDKKDTEKLEQVEIYPRNISVELHKPSIVNRSTYTKEQEEDILDLDITSEQHSKSEPQGTNQHRRNKRDIALVLMKDEGQQPFNDDSSWKQLREKGRRAQQLIEVMEEETEKEDDGVIVRRHQWFHILGVGFSRLDISLCIVLYFLSAMCLLGMYTFFRMRMRYRKGRSGFPVA